MARPTDLHIVDTADTTRRDLTQGFEVIGLVAVGSAHEMNRYVNVLTQAIARAIDATERGNLPSAKELAIAEDAARKMTILIATIQAATRPSTVRPVEIAEVLSEACSLAAHEIQIRASARLVISVEPGLQVTADRSRLVQVLLPLLVNASHAIEAKGVRGGDREIAIRAWRAERSVHIEVSDTGSGIASHVLPRIFDPYYSTKPDGKGQGIGLYLAREIVHSLRGTIEAETLEGRGSTLRLMLPVGDSPTSERTTGVVRPR